MFMDSRVCWRLLGCGQQQHAGQLLQITHLHIIYRQLTIRVNEAEYSFAQCVDLCFSYWYSRPFYSLRPVEGGIHCLLQHIHFAYIIIPRCILHSLFLISHDLNCSDSRMSQAAECHLAAGMYGTLKYVGSVMQETIPSQVSSAHLRRMCHSKLWSIKMWAMFLLGVMLLRNGIELWLAGIVHSLRISASNVPFLFWRSDRLAAVVCRKTSRVCGWTAVGKVSSL